MKLNFDGEDLANSKAPLPLEGDEVEFEICIDKPTKKKKAMNVNCSKRFISSAIASILGSH